MPAFYTSVPRKMRDLRQVGDEPQPEEAAPAEEEETPYRELQARAKELGIAANQSREDLQAAIDKAEQ